MYWSVVAALAGLSACARSLSWKLCATSHFALVSCSARGR
jgi:hypothetical protein